MQKGIGAFCKKNITMVLSACICFIAMILYMCSHVGASGEAYVKVIVDGNLYGTYSLNKDSTTRIESCDGYNTLVIKDNKVFISEADCKNQVCVHTKAISRAGGQIVCLPHKLVVSLEGGLQADDFSPGSEGERDVDAVTN